jgi:hypothetical protein
MKSLEYISNEINYLFRERRKNLIYKMNKNELQDEIAIINNAEKYMQSACIDFAVGCTVWPVLDTDRYNSHFSD